MPRTRLNARTQLGLEELESRSLLAGNPLSAGPSLSTAPDSQPGQGALIGGGFPGDMLAQPVVATSGAVGLAGFNGIGFGVYQALIASNSAPAPNANSGAPSALDGVGQMTISTGANTMGMLATSTNGIYGHTGGTGGPIVFPVPRMKLDTSITQELDVDELFDEFALMPDLDILVR